MVFVIYQRLFLAARLFRDSSWFTLIGLFISFYIHLGRRARFRDTIIVCKAKLTCYLFLPFSYTLDLLPSFCSTYICESVWMAKDIIRDYFLVPNICVYLSSQKPPPMRDDRTQWIHSKLSIFAALRSIGSDHMWVAYSSTTQPPSIWS